MRWWNVAPEAPLAWIGRLSPAERAERGKHNRNIHLSVSGMDDDALTRFTRDWIRVRPHLLGGYVAGLHHAALWLERHGLSLPPPVAIQSTTAPLTAGVRRTIERVFRAPVYDQYGSCEVYWLAAECRRHWGLHQLADVRHLEFVSADGRPVPAGETGAIAVTDLENRAFPLIRYLNGDQGRALPNPCDCGLTLPLMDAVIGRVTDALVRPDGVLVPGVFLTTLFDPWPDAVLAFQFHQKADYSVTLTVVPNPRDPRSAEAIQAVHARLSDKVRHTLPITVATANAISPINGKTRYIVSEAPPPSVSL